MSQTGVVDLPPQHGTGSAAVDEAAEPAVAREAAGGPRGLPRRHVRTTVVGPSPRVARAGGGATGAGLVADTVAESGRARKTRAHPWTLFRAAAGVGSTAAVSARASPEPERPFDATTSRALCCRSFEEMEMDGGGAGEGGERGRRAAEQRTSGEAALPCLAICARQRSTVFLEVIRL